MNIVKKKRKKEAFMVNLALPLKGNNTLF